MRSILGVVEMDRAQFFDRRRNKRAAWLFDRLVSNQGSLSTVLGDAGRQAAHRFFAAVEVSPAGILSGHTQATADRAQVACEAEEHLLIMQDTTDFDYSGHTKTTGLGAIGMGRSMGRGLHSHGALAVSPNGLPIGVVDLAIWARPSPDKNQTKADRHKLNKSKPTDQKESKKWLECIDRVQAKMPPDLKLLFIQDREADMFDLFTQARRPGAELLVRAAQPRIVEIISGTEDAISNVFHAARAATLLGCVSIEVTANPTRKARTARVEVRACPARLRAPMFRTASLDRTPRAVWLISAKEVNPPEGSTPLDWTLISTIPAPTFDDARRLINYYSRRWLIERLHFVLKSGLNAEGLRMDDAHSISNATDL